jgi:hypothetical protein
MTPRALLGALCCALFAVLAPPQAPRGSARRIGPARCRTRNARTRCREP